jgi:hypothetical protein
MCYAQIIAAIAQGVGNTMGNIQTYQNLEAQRQAAVANKYRAEAAAVDAYARGNQAAGQIAGEFTALEAQQKTGMASSGFSMDSDSYLDILAGTQGVRSNEEANAYANAAREALGLKREAEDFDAQSKQLSRDKKWAFASTFIGGASQTASSIDSIRASQKRSY